MTQADANREVTYRRGPVAGRDEREEHSVRTRKTLPSSCDPVQVKRRQLLDARNIYKTQINNYIYIEIDRKWGEPGSQA